MTATETKGYCGLSSRLLEQLRRTDIVTYKILGLGTINPSTGQPTLPGSETFIGSYPFHDKFEADEFNRDKIVKNIIKSQMKEGKEGVRFREEVEGDVIFEEGYLTVNTKTQLGLFVYMELHPANASNKWRNNNTPAKFERVAAPKTVKELLLEEDLLQQAVKVARSMSLEERRAYLGASSERMGADDIMYEVIRAAKANPKDFILDAPNEKAKARVLILDARGVDLVVHDAETRTFSLVNGKKKEKLFVYEPGTEDPVEELIEYLVLAENKLTLNKIREAYVSIGQDE